MLSTFNFAIYKVSVFIVSTGIYLVDLHEHSIRAIIIIRVVLAHSRIDISSDL